MAQLKSTVVAGDLSVTGAISSNSISTNTSFSDVYKPAIAVSYTASVTTSPYKPALWVYNLREHTLTDGMIITVKIPVATTNYSAFISIDNGTTYKPIVVSNSTGRLTTHYSVGDILVLFYDADGSCVTYAMTGATGTSTITGGCWCVLSSYDSGNTDTRLRTFSSATNINVPLIGSSYANSTTAAWTTYTGTHKDWYGVIPNDDSKRAKINLSTGLVQIPGGITSTGLITATKFKQTSTSAWSIALNDTGWTQQTNAITASGIAAGDYTCNKSNSNIPASTEADLIMGLALNNTAEARAEAGAIGLRLYEVTSGGICKFTATAVPTNTINVVIKALV